MFAINVSIINIKMIPKEQNTLKQIINPLEDKK